VQYTTPDSWSTIKYLKELFGGDSSSSSLVAAMTSFWRASMRRSTNSNHCWLDCILALITLRNSCISTVGNGVSTAKSGIMWYISRSAISSQGSLVLTDPGMSSIESS
jgi:hypothetical protein